MNRIFVSILFLPFCSSVSGQQTLTLKRDIDSLQKVQKSLSQKEIDKNHAIAEMKRKNGCVLPDQKKIEAAKVAQEKFKNRRN